MAVTTDAGNLHLWDAEGETIRRAVEGQRTVRSPTWGPNGDCVACYLDDVPTIIDPADGYLGRLDVPSFDRFLDTDRMVAWDDDGNRLAVTFVDRETTQVGVFPIPDGELVWHPSWSYGIAYTAHQYFAQRGIVGPLINYRR